MSLGLFSNFQQSHSMSSVRVLVVDDDSAILSSLKLALEVENMQVDVAGGVRVALEHAKKESYDVALLDLSLPDGNGIDLLSNLLSENADLICIMMSGQATVDVAVKATQRGAVDFLEKPISSERTLVAIRNALRLRDAEAEASRLREQTGQLRDLRGDSAAMVGLRDLVARAAKSSAHVLLHGERGTGKELVARAIHDASPRSSRSMQKINCAAVPDTLIESELFGHEAGAFTGATKRRIGKFELAHRGTLFLDEVGDMPSSMQAKLLRVLQEQELERVGGSATIKVDVRVVAATNKDLLEEVRVGRFRADLFDRLNVVPIELPPLRQRHGDIEPLSLHFFEWAKKRNDRPQLRLSASALSAIAAHDFPGNVRELRNLLERLVILCPGDEVSESFVRHQGIGQTRSETATTLYQPGQTFKELSEAAERSILQQALAHHEGQMAKTAKALGLERSHLYKKAKSLGLRD
jgi:DNA-binding NtrC family response regulator